MVSLGTGRASEMYRGSPKAEIQVPGINIQLVNYRWPARHASTDAFEGHMISLSLSAVPQAARARVANAAHSAAGPLGELVFLPSNTILSAWCGEAEQTILRCCYSESRFAAITGHRGDWSSGDLDCGLNVTAGAARSDMSRIAGELVNAGYRKTIALEALAELLAVDLMRHLGRVPVTERDHRAGGLTGRQMMKLQQRIQDAQRGFPSVSELARHLGISERHLSRAFKQETGTSVMQHLQMHRKNRAIEMLRTTGLPIKSIAAQLGFRSASYFSSVLKELTGRVPRDFRRG